MVNKNLYRFIFSKFSYAFVTTRLCYSSDEEETSFDNAQQPSIVCFYKRHAETGKLLYSKESVNDSLSKNYDSSLLLGTAEMKKKFVCPINYRDIPWAIKYVSDLIYNELNIAFNQNKCDRYMVYDIDVDLYDVKKQPKSPNVKFIDGHITDLVYFILGGSCYHKAYQKRDKNRVIKSTRIPQYFLEAPPLDATEFHYSTDERKKQMLDEYINTVKSFQALYILETFRL